MDHKENWELSKENIQPLCSGRRMANLLSSLDTSTEDQELLFNNKLKTFDAEINNYNGDDHLEPWIGYISFLEQAFVCNAKTKCTEVINRCVQKFLNDTSYNNDRRFIDVLVKSMANIEPVDRVPILKNLLSRNKVGCKVSRMYIAMAEDFESIQQYPKAIEVLNEGIKEEALPIAYLHDALTQLQFRVAERVSKQILEGKSAEPRNFGCSVPLCGPDAPSVRTQLPPAEATQSKPTSKNELKRVHLFTDENTAVGEKTETSAVKVTSHFETVRSDKENSLEPTKWNRQDNVIPDKDEFYPRSRPQNAIQVYADESSAPIEKCKIQPQEGVLSDRSEPNDFKKPIAISAQLNVKIMYRKNQIYVNGKEISFEHFRAMEYRQRLQNTHSKDGTGVVSCERNNVNTIPDKEKEEYLKRIQETDAALKQFKKKAESERLQLKEEIRTLQNTCTDLNSQKLDTEKLLQELEVSYHGLKHTTDQEKEHLMEQLSDLERKCNNLYIAFEKQKQVEMANWKDEFYDKIKQSEETRLRKEFEEAKYIMASKFDQQNRELQTLLENEKRERLNLEKKLLIREQQIERPKPITELSCDVTDKKEGQTGDTNASVYQYENMSETNFTRSDRLDISASMISSSNIMPHTTTMYSHTDISKNDYNSNCGNDSNAKNISTKSSAVVHNSNGYMASENYTPQPTSANQPAFRSFAPISSDAISQAAGQIGKPQSFKLPPKFPAKKMKAFSLYESQVDTLNLGNSTRANMSQMHSIGESDSFQKRPENMLINNALTTLGKENKENVGSRKPLGFITAPAAPETVTQEELEEEAYVRGHKPNYMDDTKAIDFNITNNLTRALAMNKPLLVSTPDSDKGSKGTGFQRPNPIIYGDDDDSDENDVRNGGANASVYVDVDDYDDDEDDEKPESRDHIRGNRHNYTEGLANPNLSTIQETSKENRSTYTSSSSGSCGNMTNITRGYASGGLSSLGTFTRSGSVPPSTSRLYPYTSQNQRKSNYEN